MGQTCCPHDYSDGVDMSLGELCTGDILLTRDPAFSKAGACLAQGLLCWGVNHGGIAVDPADFPIGGHLRTRLPYLVPGKKYMLHALMSGIRVWDLEEYLERMEYKGPPTGAIFVRQLQADHMDSKALRAHISKVIDSVFFDVADKAYEGNWGSMVAGYFDSCEGVCTCCEATGDDDEYFCTELVAAILLKADIIRHERPADEFMPTDFLLSDGETIELTSFDDGYSIGPVHALQLPDTLQPLDHEKAYTAIGGG